MLDNQEHLNNNDIINNIGWKILDFICAVLLFIGVALLCILFILLTIITLGGTFWGPWLFKKIFSCCYDFEDTVVPTNETDNQKSSNQNPMPNQGNNLEKNSNDKENEFA